MLFMFIFFSLFIYIAVYFFSYIFVLFYHIPVNTFSHPRLLFSFLSPQLTYFTSFVVFCCNSIIQFLSFYSISFVLPSSFFCWSPSFSQLLIQSEADLFVEDEDKLTPCDHAERHHHTELALSLESQMVFSSSSAQQSNTVTRGETSLLQYKEVRAQL